MIATGGLLRINARRQDSTKTHKPHTHKRRKKKRRNEVVVVKAKVKLCSLSGLVAGLGILVLLVGVVMAALGYWPREGLFFRGPPQEGATTASLSSSNSTAEHADAQGGPKGEELHPEGEMWAEQHTNDGDGPFNGTTRQWRGFLQEFLDRYLYSDRLKVCGPLIMGFGIFLFICANAVLHENRDQKTKVINLRDIYSTVIDLHSLRRPHPSSSSGPAPRLSANPLNGLVNYVQSKSLECKQSTYPGPLMGRREGGGGESVFSIYQSEEAPPPDCPPSQRGFFTLPLRRPPPPTPRRTYSARARTRRGWGEGGCDGQEVVYPSSLVGSSPSPPILFQEAPSVESCSYASLHQEASGGSKARLLQSCSSLSPSHLSLSSSSTTVTPPHRRRSLPSAGYSKLSHKDDRWFASTSLQRSEEMTSQREKLMMSQADTGPTVAGGHQH